MTSGRARPHHTSIVALAAFVFLGPMSRSAGDPQKPMDARVVEIRSYNLKPGTRDTFHELVLREALPMLRRWGIDVVAHGPSLHDENSYYLMRSFDSLPQREAREEAFYGSDEWRNGPREAILSMIDGYATVAVRLDHATVQGLRQDGTRRAGTGQASAASARPRAAAASDVATLLALNAEYLRAVERSDAGWFERALAQDFFCSMSDGTFLDRDAFLAHAAEPAGLLDLQAHDVNVRLMEDFAIVHARTTFRLSDGRAGRSRYTDVWARRDGRWLAVSAHITRY